MVQVISAQAESGPEYITRELTDAGVFEAPGFELTSAYDAYRKFDHLQGLFFNALDYEGKPTKAFCYYGAPENLAPGEKVPGVVLVHGGGGTVIPEWVKMWTDRGYAAISIDLEGHVPPDNKTTHEFSGPARSGFFGDGEAPLGDQWFYHAVADVLLANSLLRSFDEIDSTKIGVTGISWGGILTSVIGGIDDRFDFAVPVYGCGYLHESPLYNGQLYRQSETIINNYLDNWEPSHYLPLFTMPTFYVNGTNDKHFSMNSFTKSFLDVPVEKYIRVEHLMAHGHGAGRNVPAIYDFADYILGISQTRPLSFVYRGREGDVVTFSYEGEIDSTAFYSIADTLDWDGVNTEWVESSASIDETEKVVTASVPAGTQYFFVNGTMPNGSMFSSHMVNVLDTAGVVGVQNFHVWQSVTPDIMRRERYDVKGRRLNTLPVRRFFPLIKE